MQTFLTYPSFTDTAKILDHARLGKQRQEALQILRILLGEEKGFKDHPAVRMWAGHIESLAYYGMCMCREWIRRGHYDNLKDEFYPHLDHLHYRDNRPRWCWDTNFLRAHQSNLVRKDPKYYRKYFPDVPDNLPYIWPEEE